MGIEELNVESGYWKSGTLADLTAEEREKLRAGSAWRSPFRPEHLDDGRVLGSLVACRPFHADACRCNSDRSRHAEVRDGIDLQSEEVTRTVVSAGMSARRKFGSERDVLREDVEEAFLNCM